MDWFLYGRDLRHERFKVISKCRMKGAGSIFASRNQNNVICEYHFKNEEIKKAPGNCRKTLVKGVVPSVLRFTLSTVSSEPLEKRCSPNKAFYIDKTSSESKEEGHTDVRVQASGTAQR